MSGAGFQEAWEPGQAFRDMEHRLQAIVQQRANIEEARKVPTALLFSSMPIFTPAIPEPNLVANLMLVYMDGDSLRLRTASANMTT